MRKTNLIFFLVIISFLKDSSKDVLFAQIDYLKHEDSYKICDAKFQLAISNRLYEKSLPEIFITIAKSFIGTDYEGFVLEKPEKEEVFIYLKGLDCVSLIENSLVLARLIKTQRYNYEDYLKELEFIRYRNGEKKDYLSRLHYFSDWIYENEKKGILKNVSRDLGGNRILTKNISFMTNNLKLYPKLKSEEDVRRMKVIESSINERDVYYIGKEQIIVGDSSTGNDLEQSSLDLNSIIHEGDIIALVSADTTLDITHTTIAARMDDGVHLLHAPKPSTKVQITEKTLSEYIKSSKTVKGLIVVKLMSQI